MSKEYRMPIRYNFLHGLLARIYWKKNKIIKQVFINKEIREWETKQKEVDFLRSNNEFTTDIKDIKIFNSDKEIVSLPESGIWGEIDEHGRVFSNLGFVEGKKNVNKENFVKRRKNDIYLISIEGKVGIKKIYRGNKVGFLRELKALYSLNKYNCNVPCIMDVDFGNQATVISYIRGFVLEEKENEIEKSFVDSLYAQLKIIHDAGFFLNDLSYKNIIEDCKGRPCIIDFEMCSHKSETGFFYGYFKSLEYDRFYKLFGIYRNLF